MPPTHLQGSSLFYSGVFWGFVSGLAICAILALTRVLEAFGA